MSESRTIAPSLARPNTVSSLAAQLATLGLTPGLTLLVHSSLSALGWVAGGAHAVVLALEQALGSTGTLVMPAASTALIDPALWDDPPVPEHWWPVIRAELPLFDPALTPTHGMGAIVECFRTQPETLRSSHPHVSFVARGPEAPFITREHELAEGQGERSPLARVYERDGYVLLLGVGHANNTSLHLAEYRAEYPGKRYKTRSAPLLVEGARHWVSYRELVWNDEDFGRIGADFARDTGLERVGAVGRATARLMSQRALVDYATEWMRRERTAPPATSGSL